MTVKDFLDYVKETKSKNTFKEYKRGIAKFCEWYGKTGDEVLEERRQDWVSGDLFRKKRFAREIEKFHKALIEEQGYAINSARTYTLGILQLFRFYEMTVTISVGSDVSKTVISTKDFVPNPQQLRKMYQVAPDLRSKLIMSLGKDLAWRIGDFLSITKDMLPDLEQEPPISFDLITEKEDVLARSFVSAETVELLKDYLVTVEHSKNPYLFPSNGKNPLSKDTVNRTLRALAEKAQVKIPKNKRLRFHCFRKRFLSECANLHVDVNTAKILVGKSVEKSMLTYLSEVEHRKSFLLVQERLRLTEKRTRTSKTSASELERIVEKYRRLLNILSGLNPILVEKAKEVLRTTFKNQEDYDVWCKTKTFAEMLERIDTSQQAKQRKQYNKLIEENNNNHA